MPGPVAGRVRDKATVSAERATDGLAQQTGAAEVSVGTRTPPRLPWRSFPFRFTSFALAFS